MLATLVMTVIGPDRTGLVADFARTVADQGGNWLESRMSHLGGQFAGLMSVAIDETKVADLRAALETLAVDGYHVTIQDSGVTTAPVEGTLASVDLVGQDRPGLLREITGVFAKHGLNVEELSSELGDAPQEGGTLFRASATLLVPAQVDLNAVGDDLERIANDLMVDIQLAPAD